MTTILFKSDLQTRLDRYLPGPRGTWTLVGLAAIPLWALWPLLAVISVSSVPPLQFATIIFAVAAATMFAFRQKKVMQATAGQVVFCRPVNDGYASGN